MSDSHISPRSSNGGDSGEKRHRESADSTGDKRPVKRRQIACQSCRVRKVKCDNGKPSCGFCISSGVVCEYIKPNNDVPRLDPAATLMMSRLDQILEEVGALSNSVRSQQILGAASHHRDFSIGSAQDLDPRLSTPTAPYEAPDLASKDYLRIPWGNSTADAVLTWPIFQGAFTPQSLIEQLFESPQDDDNCADTFSLSGGLEPLPDERIPSLIDRFLSEVHTKNPILDVEALIAHGRRAVSSGLGWDASSCLVLLACALGSIAKPFEVCTMDAPGHGLNAQGATSSSIYASNLRQAESCYILARRRLGILNQTVVGAQCFFYSAVYLMYTFRALPAWNHFCQASTFYQIHSSTIIRLSEQPQLDSHLAGMSITQRRIEQSLYWSCFKSECEIRVELPLNQSSIADIEFPHMFPSPPSRVTEGFPAYNVDPLSFDLNANHYADNKELSEEVSWYYYLTEVALRRISNRILNTFYRNPHTSWMNIQPLIPIAKEFETQIIMWSQNLPPAMQYHTTPTSPHEVFSASRELSWATSNRLLEMKAWLYQPFLYYAIHSSRLPASPGAVDREALRSLVQGAMDCNAQTIQNRTLRHRHHGIWFDARAVLTASFSVIAALKSGNVDVGRDWEKRMGEALAMLRFWEGEAPDLRRARAILGELWEESRPLLGS